MDLRLLFMTFVTVFLAELGDKTQLATLAFAVEGKSRVVVFLGSALALVSTSAIAVIAGETMSRLVAPALLKRLAGVSFLFIGAWVLWSSRK
jgi:putative Ca2+/H+ antiporter (TMEM165/GDT1 family)